MCESRPRVSQRFVEGTDEFRNSRFKFICKLVHAPWLVSTAVSNLGGERPAILGKKLTVVSDSHCCCDTRARQCSYLNLRFVS